MANVEDGRDNVAGELKKTGQKLLTAYTHVHGTSRPCSDAHMIWSRVEHRAFYTEC